MNTYTHLHEEIVKECEGCMFCGPRIIGGDKTIICRRCPYPHTKWWYGQKCECYKKKE
jgi:hypothetical protein